MCGLAMYTLNCTFDNNSVSYKYGGAFYVRSVYLTVSNSIFTRNKAKQGGGAIYIQEHTLFITNTVFANNSASNGPGGVLTMSNGIAELSRIAALYNVGYGTGVFYIHDTTTVITNSTFIGNSAMQHEQLGLFGVIHILECTVTFSGMNTMIDNMGSNISASSASIYFTGPTNISSNHGININGGGLSATLSQIYFNRSAITFFNNSADNGGAIFLAESLLYVCPQHLFMSYNTAQNGAGIYGYQSIINKCDDKKQSSEVVITNNYASHSGGGIWALGTTIQLLSSNVYIDHNSAAFNGGGMFLQQNPKIYLLHGPDCLLVYDWCQVKLEIINNSALFGGGIFVADNSTGRGACMGGSLDPNVRTNYLKNVLSDCFIQTINFNGKTNDSLDYVKTIFSGNTAKISGSNIYGVCWTDVR